MRLPARVSRMSVSLQFLEHVTRAWRLGPDRVPVPAVSGTTLAHERWLRWAEEALGLMFVVDGTAQLKVLYGSGSAHGVRKHVMEFEEAGLGTPTARADERTSPAVTGPDRAPDSRGDVPRARRCRTRSPWAIGRGQFGSGDIIHQQRERPIEDLGGVAVRNGMSQQVLHSAQLLVRLPRDRELDLVPFRREGRHHGRARRRQGYDRRRR